MKSNYEVVVAATEPSVPLVDLELQYRSIKAEIDEAVLGVIASTQFVLGDELGGFEQEFAAFCGARHCVGVGSGTSAIQLALEALEIGHGDEVIVPANTFFGSVLPVLKVGAAPVLVDCDADTATIDVDAAGAAVGPRTRAVLAVHLYGHPADTDALQQLCEGDGLALIEDACQAHGARYKSRRVGSLGTIAAFSFYPSKNLGAYGDGGAVTTDDPQLAERVSVLRNLGQSRRYTHVAEGWNERLDSIQAAVLRVKLRHLDRWNALRRRNAAAYEQALRGSSVRTMKAASWAEHVWHLYPVRTPNRDQLSATLAAEGIGTGIHYPVPLHEQPVLARLGYRRGDFPVAEAWADQELSLPMFAELEPHEIERVCSIAAAWEENAA